MRNGGANNRHHHSVFSFLIYGAVLVLLAAALVLLYPVYREYQKSRRELSEVRTEEDRKHDQVAELKKFNAELVDSPQAAEKVARERFGLCKEGESVLLYPTPRPAAGGNR